MGAMLFASCKKSVDFIADNTYETGVGSIPVSTNPLTDLITNRALTATLTASTPRFNAGTAISVELQYFSQSPVKEINLYATVGAGARVKVSTQPYQSAFSQVKRLDTLLVPYTVPLGTASNTGIKLEYEILNANTLSLLRTGWIRVQ
jgi:hypothetical protein